LWLLLKYATLNSLRRYTGIAKGSAPIAKEDPAIFAENFNVNVLGPLVLFQAFIDLLGKSQRDLGPAFVVVSTLAASLTIQPNLAANPISAYATSKAAVNMVVRRIQIEHPDIIALELQ
jgi:norsolorinic acid ketoreductase